MDEIDRLLDQAQTEIGRCTEPDQINAIEIAWLGRHGKINQLLQKIKNVPDDARKTYGQKLNRLKTAITRQLADQRQRLNKQTDKTPFIDLTLPGTPYPKGSLHLITIAVEEISRIFEKIGFVRVSYPEVEWEYYSFASLNMPKGHPARDDFETSFIKAPADPTYGKMLLTPHTSSGQNREMRRLHGQPPIRMINIAKCYRPNWDATHTPMFFQCEGLCVDKGINISNLKGTLNYFAKEYFGADREIRLRPHHFQFTEPSFEVDVSCNLCHGRGTINGKKCKVCKSGWLELGGTGMVHPHVLKEGGVDPEVYSGWAFGCGIERIIMMKYGIDDIRYYYNGDLRFLKKF